MRRVEPADPGIKNPMRHFPWSTATQRPEEDELMLASRCLG